MPRQRPDAKSRIPSVGSLARAHGSRALRVAGICAAAAALLAVTGGTIHLLRQPAATAHTAPPSQAERLVPAWTASIGTGPVTGLAASADTLYVSGPDGLYAYALPCPTTTARTCEPEWQDPVPDGPLSSAALLNDLVLVGSARGTVYAFPVRCAELHCRPLWNGRAGSGPVPTPNANEDVTYVATRKLYAFPTHCGTNDRNCAPSWSGDLPARAAGRPADGGGLIAVSSAGRLGGLVAFPAVCVDRCRAVWTGDTGGPAGPPALSASTAYVVAHRALLAFPLSCQGSCPPLWTAPLASGSTSGATSAIGASGAPTIDGDSVYVGGADGRLYVFPSSCAKATCPATATYPLGHAPLLRPIVSGGILYVASRDGTITAIPQACDPSTPGCGTPLSRGMSSDASAGLTTGGGNLYAGDDRGDVHAFTVPALPT